MRASAFMACLMICVGCGGQDGRESVCQQASDYVSGCLGKPTSPLEPSCVGQKAQTAQQLISASCTEIRQLQASGKADDFGAVNMEEVQQRFEVLDQPCDPNVTDTCELCKEIKVELTFLGFELPTCLRRASCEFVENGVGRCQCQWTVKGFC